MFIQILQKLQFIVTDTAILVYTASTWWQHYLTHTLRGGVAQWVARLTRDRWIFVSREFEPNQRPPLFP